MEITTQSMLFLGDLNCRFQNSGRPSGPSTGPSVSGCAPLISSPKWVWADLLYESTSQLNTYITTAVQKWNAVQSIFTITKSTNTQDIVFKDGATSRQDALAEEHDFIPGDPSSGDYDQICAFKINICGTCENASTKRRAQVVFNLANLVS